jgi:hypothetical protein
MATAPKRNVDPAHAPPRPEAEGPRAKPLRRSSPATPPALRGETVAALERFEARARALHDLPNGGIETVRAAPLARERSLHAVRLSAGDVMHALAEERGRGTLPEELEQEIDRWDEGQFVGTRVDVEIANHAVAVLLGSALRLSLD